MILKKLLNSALFVYLSSLGFSAQAEQSTLRSFTAGSYQQILTNHSDQPFMMVIWSVDCSSCLKEMMLLQTIHQERPDLKMIMVSTDGLEANAQIQQILERHRLFDLENWVFADENIQKLRFEIDPRWYGELPRTYFFDRSQHRTGVSGVLSEQEYTGMLTKILSH